MLFIQVVDTPIKTRTTNTPTNSFAIRTDAADILIALLGQYMSESQIKQLLSGVLINRSMPKYVSEPNCEIHGAM
jgi:hypothetical protein